MSRTVRFLQVLLALSVGLGTFQPLGAQSVGPASTPTAPPTAPAAAAPSAGRVTPGSGQLPTDGGQVWQAYDIRPFVTRVEGLPNPERPIVEWILRETGTEAWIRPPAGMLIAEPQRIRVYHTPEIQTKVAEVIERFVRPDLASYGVSVRIITLESANWRSLALPYLRPVPVQSPGVEAWLISKEHAAMLRANLKGRVDYREHNSANVRIQHGQSHTIEQRLPRSFPQSINLTPDQYPGYQIQMGEISEGFSLEISPLAMADGRMMEVMIRCSADQIEQLNPLPIDLRSVGIASGTAQIEVPQVASWRLQERLRWPVEEVLVVSRGLVAMPGLKRGPWNGLTPLPSGPAPRADALLMLDCRTESSAGMAGTPERTAAGRLNYHGRY